MHFFATVNQMFGGSSQLPTNWEEPPHIWLTVAKSAFVGLALNFRVRMLLKSAVSIKTPCEAWFCFHYDIKQE